MNVHVKIPDEAFNHENSNISRQVLEAVALEGFKAKQLTTAQVNTRLEVYEFLAANGVPWVDYSLEDAERERQLLNKLLPS